MKQIGKTLSLRIVCAGLLLGAISCQKNDDVADKTSKTVGDKNLGIARTYRKSGQSMPPEAAANRKAFLERMSNLSKTDSRSLKSIGGKNKIGVVFKFLFDERTFNQNNIPNGNVKASAERQIRILNEGFNGSNLPENSRLNIQFQLDGVDTHWVGNDYLAESTDGEFNNGGFSMDHPQTKLYIYVVPGRSWPGISGWATGLWNNFPDHGKGSPFHVVLSQFSFVDWGGNNDLNKSQDLNSGKVIIHEVGHLFGLHHAFSGRFSCSDNDRIPDTPKQSYQQIQNSVGDLAMISYAKNNAKNALGEPLLYDAICNKNIDVIWNHMQYTPERFRKRFSPGQINAMAWGLTYKTSVRKKMLRW